MEFWKECLLVFGICMVDIWVIARYYWSPAVFLIYPCIMSWTIYRLLEPNDD